MNNILVTGSNGQLGSEFQQLAKDLSGFNFFFTDVEELDICNDEAVDDFIKSNSIDALINCAAYTAVDKAEEEQELAKQINIQAVDNLAKICKAQNVLLIHISTDYVFDGTNHRPYLETDQTNPNSFYGYTKDEGEKVILNTSGKAVIIRTSWLYSSFGKNFVKTILKYGAERDQLKVVNDQIGSPTYAVDLAICIMEIIKNYQPKGVEIFNYSNEGICSWYDFAKEIIELKNIDCKVSPIESKDYPTPAKRPFYSILNKSKISQTLTIDIPHWKDSLKICLQKH